MSLIKCIECGNLISDKSEICVHCGCPTSESVPNNQDTICYINDKAIDFSDCISEILNFINNDEIVKAIKIIRVKTYLDLKSSKDFAFLLKDTINYQKNLMVT